MRFLELLREFYDRNSRAAVLSIALGYELGVNQGKIHVSAHLIDDLIARFKIIDRYPKTEESRRAAGAFRASAAMLFMSMDVDEASFEKDAPWVGVFWDQISGFGPCLLQTHSKTSLSIAKIRLSSSLRLSRCGAGRFACEAGKLATKFKRD